MSSFLKFLKKKERLKVNLEKIENKMEGESFTYKRWIGECFVLFDFVFQELHNWTILCHLNEDKRRTSSTSTKTADLHQGFFGLQ